VQNIYTKVANGFLMKFCGEVQRGPATYRLDFGDDPDHNPKFRIQGSCIRIMMWIKEFSRNYLFTIVIANSKT